MVAERGRNNGAEIHGALTPEQRQAAELPADSRTLMLAGAGRGKTHVLIARVAHLIVEKNLLPGSEILILSYTRAAVRELRNRLQGYTGDVGFVGARTFDSFATLMLARHDPDGAWSDLDFDGRIEAATQLIKESKSAAEEIRVYRHVFVDEVQDLVGVRSELVKAVLKASDGGFTLLGDPAQGIFTFTLESEEERRDGCHALLRWLRQEFADLGEVGLTKNFRVQSEIADAAAGAGLSLNLPDPDYGSISELLRDIVDHLPAVSSIEKALEGIRDSSDNVAILCRKNVQAYLLSEMLHIAGIPHHVRRGAADRSVAPWVGALLWDEDGGSLGRNRFLLKLERLSPALRPDPIKAWAALKRLDLSPGDNISLSRIRTCLIERRFPDELLSSPPSNIVISTVHRAKGLEFDTVFVVDRDWTPDPDSLDREKESGVAEEARILYVALSRARRDIRLVPSPDTRGFGRRSWVGDRLTRRNWGGWTLDRFEVRGDDAHFNDPAGGHIVEGEDLNEIQGYILEHVEQGGSIELQLEAASQNGKPMAYYSIQHDGRCVGLTGHNFARDLGAAVTNGKPRKVVWPARIENLRVEGIDSAGGHQTAQLRAGLGGSGFWVRVRASGLGLIRNG